MKDYHFGTSGSIFSLGYGPMYTQNPEIEHSIERFSSCKWHNFLGGEVQYYFLNVCMLHCKQKRSLSKIQKMMSTKFIRSKDEFIVFLTTAWTVLINDLDHWGISSHLKYHCHPNEDGYHIHVFSIHNYTPTTDQKGTCRNTTTS